MEMKKEMEGNEENIHTRPHYRYICSNSNVGFLNLLNENEKDSYKPIMDTYTSRQCIDKETGEVYTKREAYLYDTDNTGIGLDETLKRTEISEMLLDAEFHATKARNDLKDLEDDLTLHTDWNVASSEVGNKISNKEQREAYIRGKTVEAREWMETTQQWLSHVKRLAALHVLPGIPPWADDLKPEEDAEKSNKEVDEDIVTPTMGVS